MSSASYFLNTFAHVFPEFHASEHSRFYQPSFPGAGPCPRWLTALRTIADSSLVFTPRGAHHENRKVSCFEIILGGLARNVKGYSVRKE